MYFPYVYGRQSELRAIQDANVPYCSNGKVVPIIEPVVKKPKDLLRCVELLGNSGSRLIVVTNPNQGDFHTGIDPIWTQELDTNIAKFPAIIPAYKCGPAILYADVQKFLLKYSHRQVALIYVNSQLTTAEFTSLIGLSQIIAHINVKMTSQQRAALPSSSAVDILENFNKLTRNADYSGVEIFSDQHKYFSGTGIGFGDFTITGRPFVDGGGKVAAVALHATFLHPASKDIWVEHFVSDDTDINTGSAASKYLEAATKFTAAAIIRNNEFGTNSALNDYANDVKNAHYPGLGKSKQRQIYHHIALVHDVLHGKLK